uniref:ATP synthase complex subunit 8 n=1 Tax=Trigonopterus porg TaxID=2678944 RepID=A0A7H1KI47_9CUCU|nr:ATP synthase F0 subunit 8 [Trigonopterus porg]QNT26963.1 ATP synthase F0 subunit 8 [Trigonopterus porg]
MPQMAPINWTLLYIFITTLFFVTIVINYFLFIYKPLHLPLNKTVKSTSWQW